MNFNSKINPIGNYDDPVPPTSFKPRWWEPLRRIRWLTRNPLHNFMFYWIGITDVDRVFVGEFLTEGWQFAHSRTKHFKFPIISYKGPKWEFYIGWRRNGGFGMALRAANAKDASKVD